MMMICKREPSRKTGVQYAENFNSTDKAKDNTVTIHCEECK